MPNMTLAIPADLKEKMDQFKEINWSEVARQAIREKTLLLERMNQMLSKSELTPADIKRARLQDQQESLAETQESGLEEGN